MGKVLHTGYDLKGVAIPTDESLLIGKVWLKYPVSPPPLPYLPASTSFTSLSIPAREVSLLRFFSAAQTCKLLFLTFPDGL